MDTEKDGWVNPFETLFFLRCTSVKYAKDFIEKGSVKFGTPKAWEEAALKSHIIGRGDPYEGTIAFAHSMDIEHILELNIKYPNTDRLYYNNRTLFKRVRSMNLPCFCMYGLNIDQFNTPKQDGWQKVKAEIPASYFFDFVDNKTVEEVFNLPEEDKPAVIVINNPSEFRKRVENYLISIGCDKNEIMFNYVNYMNFDKYGEDGWFDFSQIEPKELFIKSDSFSSQKEVRIVVNTDKKDVLEKLNSPQEIGSMKDIATVLENFFKDGIKVETKVNSFIQK